MKKIIIITLAALSLGLGSCKKYLDINKDPYAVNTVSPDLLFTYAITNWAGNRASGDNYIPNALMIQSIASGGNYGWGAENVYDFSIYSLGNTWKTYYSSAGNNLKEAIGIAESSEIPNKTAAGQCKITLAALTYEITMFWGDVPFKEAWDAENFPYPHFDTQEEVFNSLLSLLDEGMENIKNGDPLTAITAGDLFYKGNLEKWTHLANSLKFKILMTMVDKDPSKKTAIANLLSEGQMISSAGDNLQMGFENTPRHYNPKFALLKAFAGGSNLFFFANNLVLQPMKAQNDPRIPKYFDMGLGVTDYIGVNTEQEADTTIATISMYLYRPDAPELIFSYQEQLFLEAEAYARGLGVAPDLGTADAKYKDALLAACLYYGVSSTDANDFVATKTLMNSNDAVKEIHLQQWIDLMDRPIEEFNNWRRSGPEGAEVPALTLPPGAPSGPLFRRWVYPNAEEISPNPNAPKNNPQYYEKLWFDL